MAEGAITVRVLGPVQVIGADGAIVELPSASQRRLLAALALHAGGPVRAEWLCGVLDVTSGALRTSVSRLRRVVGDGLKTTVGGYRLDVTVDAALAGAEIQAAEGDPAALRRALARWVGPALEEFADEAWAVGDAVRLASVRAIATEDLGETLLARGQPEAALEVLEPHVVEHPFRDRPRGLIIRALAAGGRRTEALRAYQTYRDLLAETAGTEPSEELRAIEQRVAAGWDGVDAEPPVDHAPVGGGHPRGRALHETLASAPTSVGRRHELAALASAAERAADGSPQAVLLSGEAGIGKTTLIATFARGHGASSGWAVFYGRCDEQDVVPFQPFQALITRIAAELPDDVLMAHTAACGGDLLRLVPQLHTRVPAVPATGGDETTARHLLFAAVTDIVERAAAITPLMLVVDDLHWADPAALLLLRHLVRHIVDRPVLFLAGFRDTGEATDDHLRTALADLARHDAVRIELEGLDVAELGDLVLARAADATDHEVGPMADRLRAETAGNPLFAEHLLRHWAASGPPDLGEPAMTPTTSAVIDVPSSLRDLVWQRVAVLGPEAQPVLTAAAVLGVQFNERVLAAMPDLEGRDVAEVLDRAVAAGVLADHPSIAGTVRFTHALVARSMDAELGSRARTRLHAQAYGAILATQATHSLDLSPRLARHAEMGGLPAEALHWAVEAGDQAWSNLAPDEAARWFAKAIDLAETLERPEAERADLLVRLGEAGYRAGLADSFDTIRRGAELAEACGADATLIRAAFATDRGSIRIGSFAAAQLGIVEAAMRRAEHADLVTRARLTALLAQSLGHVDQAERRTAVALEALTLARSSLDPTVLARVAPDVLYALWAPGAGAIRAALAAEATAVVDEMADPHLTFVLYYSAFLSMVCAGDADGARRCEERLRVVAEEIGEPQMRWTIGIMDGFKAVMQGRFAEAQQIMDTTLELGLQIGEADALSMYLGQSFCVGTFAGRHAEMFPVVQQAIEDDEFVELPFRIAHAIVSCEVGKVEVGAALLRDAMQRPLDAIPQDLMRSTSLIGYAILAIELDDAKATAWLFPEIVPMAGEVSFNGLSSQGPVSAYIGKLASLLGRYDEAEQYLRDALELAESFGWEYHRATTFLALAQNRLRADGHLDAEGERWLATAEELCARYGIDAWAKRAATLRRQVAA